MTKQLHNNHNTNLELGVAHVCSKHCDRAVKDSSVATPRTPTAMSPHTVTLMDLEPLGSKRKIKGCTGKCIKTF